MAKDKFESFIQVDTNGIAKIYNREYLDKFFKEHPNQRFELIIHKQRSKQQNKYYWSVLKYISDELSGQVDDQQLHEVFKFKFLQIQTGIVDESTGEELIYLKSTTEISKQEFNEYIEKIARYCAQTFSITIPQPNEQLEADLD